MRLSSDGKHSKTRQEQASTVGEIARDTWIGGVSCTRDCRRPERALDSGPLSKSQLLLTLTDTCFFSIHTNLCPPLLRPSTSKLILRSRPSLCACIAWPYSRHEPQHPPRQQQRACPECAASCSNQEHLSHATRRPIRVFAPFSPSNSS